MTDAREIVERYHDAWERGDFDEARSHLHDKLRFEGPIETFDRADDYLTALRRLAPMVQAVEHRGLLVDGDDAAIFFELVTPKGRAPVAEWYRIRGGKIAEVRAYFDARPFAPSQ